MPRPAPSTSRVALLLNHLGEHPDTYLSLSEIARRLDLNKATVHGMLAALSDSGFVVRHPDEKTYSLGPALAAVGRSVIADELEIVKLARGEMEALAELAGGQCAANCIVGSDVVIIAVTGTPTGPGGATPGLRGPLRPPFGAVFLAWEPDSAVDRYLGPTLDDAERARYRTVLRAIRARGFSAATLAETRQRLEEIMRELLAHMPETGAEAELIALMDEFAREDSEILEIATDRLYRTRQITAPVFAADGTVKLGLVLTGLDERYGSQIRDYGYALTTAARRVTELIGGVEPQL